MGNYNNIKKAINKAIDSTSRQDKINCIKTYAGDEYENHNDLWVLAAKSDDDLNMDLVDILDYHTIPIKKGKVYETYIDGEYTKVFFVEDATDGEEKILMVSLEIYEVLDYFHSFDDIREHYDLTNLGDLKKRA